jgi:flotillin
MAAQIPALFETLSGMKMSELFSKVQTIGNNKPKPEPEGPPSALGTGAGK